MFIISKFVLRSSSRITEVNIPLQSSSGTQKVNIPRLSYHIVQNSVGIYYTFLVNGTRSTPIHNIEQSYVKYKSRYSMMKSECFAERILCFTDIYEDLESIDSYEGLFKKHTCKQHRVIFKLIIIIFVYSKQFHIDYSIFDEYVSS